MAALSKKFNPPPVPSQEDINAFCNAGKSNDRATVDKYLEQFGANIIDERDNMRDNALTWAAWMGHAEMCAYLLERGAAVNAQGMTNRNALGWAAQGGRAECAKVLLAAGADMNQPDAEGRSPLKIAQDAGRSDLLEMMSNEAERRIERARLKKEREDGIALTAKRQEMLRKFKPPKLKS
jgi:ankyrin repeat protein